MAVTASALTALYDYLKAQDAPSAHISTVSELIAQRANRAEKASSNRSAKSAVVSAEIASAVEHIITSDAFKGLNVIMNADVRTALQNEGVATPTVPKATKALGMMVERGYLIETVPPKGVSCRCYARVA